MTAITKREIASYFTTPLGYVFLAVFCGFSGLFLWLGCLRAGQSDMGVVFSMMFFILMIMLPVLTMRTMAEDKRRGIDRLTLTSPVSVFGIVAGKFLGAFAVFFGGMIVMFIYAVFLSAASGNFGWVTFWGNFLGMSLIGALFISIGIFISNLTENQMIAAVGSIGANIAICMFDAVSGYIPNETVKNVLNELSVYYKYSEFTVGILSLKNAVFFLSVTGIFLFLTARSVGKRLRNGGSTALKAKRTALSAAFTVTVTAAVVLLNAVVGVISDRVNVKADLTAEEIYSLDKATSEYLGGLETDVKITVLNSEKDFASQDSSYRQVSEILERMEAKSEHISLEYLDIDQNPNYTAKFKGETIAENYIVAECEKTGRHKVISPYEYFSFNQSYLQYYGAYVVESSNIEQEAVSAMMYVSSERLIRVAFTEGYGEADSSALRELLSKNGFEVETLQLATTPEIDADVDFIVINAPALDMDKEQLAKLDSFLDNGGEYGKTVMYFASTVQPKTPNIDEFLSDWGLSVGFEAIGQSDESCLTSADTLYAHLQQICDTEYTKTVFGSGLYTFGIHMRPVYAEENGTADCVTLMKTFDGAFLYPLDKGLAESFDVDKAERGEYNDAIVSSRTNTDGVKSRVCAIGSEMFASNAYMSYSNSDNAEFFTGMWDSISGRDRGVTIKAKSLAPAVFEMNVRTANTLAVILCIAVPVSVIMFGIVIWARRRHR